MLHPGHGMHGGEPTTQTFDVEDRWPELFVQLDHVQRKSVRQSLAAAWRDGFNPTREDAENLTNLARVDERRA